MTAPQRQALTIDSPPALARAGIQVNDIHSRLNPTRVKRVARPRSSADVCNVIAAARRRHEAICIAGGRHAMGGQQFATGGVLLEMQDLSGTLGLDEERGLVEVRAGTRWPELITSLRMMQRGRRTQWGIAQKQTGADRLTIGGALAANIHGRGLRMAPIVADVESFVLVDADGRVRNCSRTDSPELFRLAIGGYGLFGVMTSVTLRLTRRRRLERVVELTRLDDLVSRVDAQVADGAIYGDFQFATDPGSDDFLSRGVLSIYRPATDDAGGSASPMRFTPEDWRSLIHLAHVDKTAAFERYASHYLATSGQIYWSDTHQLSTYLDDYHRPLDRRIGAIDPATEVITEVYVPVAGLAGFMADVREDFRDRNVDVVYGTIRFVERDRDTFLAWARKPYACVVFNLCTRHTRGGRAASAEAFRRLIDRAIERGGSYYLTYHRHASREQVLACYPRFREFLQLKRLNDPEEIFQSDWYRHYRQVFGLAG
jgi:FAD/FMN-containing dehydrogenase